jgi:C-terminal processing protease CtpA/Prc
MPNHRKLLVALALLLLTSFACQALGGTPEPVPTAAPEATRTPAPSPTPLLPLPVQPGVNNPDEPVFVRGTIEYTSPFFLNAAAEPFVLLEDQAGFAARDREFIFALAGQSIGPVDFLDDGVLGYSLALPSVPQGTFLDVDNNGKSDTGVQVFAVAYWSNIWGGPFLEERDGGGWSTGYASTITDPNREDEISGGILIIWAPDDQQAFPTGFGEDGRLFTADDPTAPMPAGYTLVDLNEEPFRFYKEAEPVIDLYEGVIAVNDYSGMDFLEAFEALFEKASREYPFTADKNIDWPGLYSQFSPRFEVARTQSDFYKALRDFTYAIPDGHVGVTIDPETFFFERGGSFGLVLAELSDGRVIATQVLPETPAAAAGILPGAEITTWGGQPVQAALDAVEPYFGPYSTQTARRAGQVVFLTRVAPDTRLELGYRNPAAATSQQVTLTATVEYDSLFASMAVFNQDEMELPVSGRMLVEAPLGYIRLSTFSDDYNLMARLWERYIQALIASDVPGLVIDIRLNSGGSSGLARDFAGYFFNRELELFRRSYFNEYTQVFEYLDVPFRVKPAPLYYNGQIAVLIGVECVSACEGFAYTLAELPNVTLVGHTGTAGAFGEVGRGQYKLPGELSMQFPTGRSETLDGALVIEGRGVQPDVLVPVTYESAMGQADVVLEAAIEVLLQQIR